MRRVSRAKSRPGPVGRDSRYLAAAGVRGRRLVAVPPGTIIAIRRAGDPVPGTVVTVTVAAPEPDHPGARG